MSFKEFSLFCSLSLLSGACIPVHRPAGTAGGGLPTVWNFEDAVQPFAAASGSAVLQYRDPTRSGWGPLKTRFVRTGEFGLASLPDGDKTVMRFAATTPNEGFTLTHFAPPNGAFAANNRVSSYTIVMDLLWPKTSARVYRSFFQTNATNSDDGDFFAQPTGAIGVGGLYQGALVPGRWHRVAIAVSAVHGGTGGQIHSFIDGRLVGESGAPEPGKVSRWAIGPSVHLFTDDNNETAEGCLSSLYFVDRIMSNDEIEAMGGPTIGGAGAKGAPPAVLPSKP